MSNNVGFLFSYFLVYAAGEEIPDLKIHLLFPKSFLDLLKLLALIKASKDVSAYSYLSVGLNIFQMPI